MQKKTKKLMGGYLIKVITVIRFFTLKVYVINKKK